MWRCAASLERLAPEAKEALGDALVKELARPTPAGYVLWCLGRLGARVPLYGPANTVVRTRDGRALDRGAARPPVRPRPRDEPTPSSPWRSSRGSPATAPATWPIKFANRCSQRLEQLGRRRGSDASPVREYHELEAAQEGQALGDALPIGLRLRQEAAGPSAAALPPEG